MPRRAEALFLVIFLAGCSDGGADLAGAAANIDRARYLADLQAIASARPPGSPQHKKVQQLCKERLQQLGFTVELHAYGTGTNVVGKLKGTGAPAEEVLISAHYISSSSIWLGLDMAAGLPSPIVGSTADNPIRYGELSGVISRYRPYHRHRLSSRDSPRGCRRRCFHLLRRRYK